MKTRIASDSHELNLNDASVFGTDAQENTRLFVRRALTLPEVRAIAVDPTSAQARITFTADANGRNSVLGRLANTVQGHDAALSEDHIPDWSDNHPRVWIRSAQQIASLAIDDRQPGCWSFSHAWLAGHNNILGKQLSESLSALVGIRSARIDASNGKVTILYRKDWAGLPRMMRVLENVFGQYRPFAEVTNPAHVPMQLANTTVGLGAVGEILLPIATPVAAGVLVATNLNIVRDAAVQLTQGKVGVPLFHTALLSCSIITGQVLAFALTDWSLRFWQQRWRRQLVDEAQALINTTTPDQTTVRLIDGEGLEETIQSSQIQSGHKLRVLAGEIIPADGHVTAGEALVDEILISGNRLPSRMSPGNPVLAGSRVLAGGLDLIVERTGINTRAGKIRHTLTEVVSRIPSEPSLHGKAEQLADKTALPTLATAGVGWIAGDLITVGAILHQDWVSGPQLAVPLLTLKHIRSALACGAVVQQPSAIARLCESDFLVLDGDDPHLMNPGLELVEIRSQTDNTNTLLRHVAGAALYLGGDMADTLAEACQSAGLVIRQPQLISLEPDGGVLVQVGKRRLRLKANPMEQGAVMAVEIDGDTIGEFIFSHTSIPKVTRSLLRFKALGIPTFLMSSADEEQVSNMAAQLGIELYGSRMDNEQKLRFLDGLRKRGQKVIYAGRLSTMPEVVNHAHVTVAVEDFKGYSLPSDVVMLDGYYKNIAALVEMARQYEPEIRRATHSALIPNALCIAGGFGGMLNGITSGIIANIGVINVDRKLKRSLADSAFRTIPLLTQNSPEAQS